MRISPSSCTRPYTRRRSARAAPLLLIRHDIEVRILIWHLSSLLTVFRRRAGWIDSSSFSTPGRQLL